MDNADQLLIQELLARVTALENGGSSKDGGDEGSLRQRLQAERESRIDKQAEGRFKANEATRNGPRPTGQHRRDEMLRRTSNTIPAATTPPPSRGTPQDASQTTGTPLDFYVWKDGQVAIVKVLCDGEPTLVT